MPRSSRFRGGVLIALTLTFPSSVAAGDGVVEINQVCAVQTGCLSGDAAGFPVTIDRPGSYRLTSDLLADAAPVEVIDIQSDFVTLDLGGFQIVGDNVCLGFPPSQDLLCTGASVHAVRATTSTVGNEVRNGSIVRAPGSAVLLGGASIVRAMRISEAAGFATLALTGSRFHDVQAHRSTGGNFGGTHRCESCLITEATSFESGSDGIGGFRILVLDSRAQSSRHAGIDVNHALVARSVAANNGSAGVSVFPGIAERSVGLSNRAFVQAASGAGIQVINWGLILECTARANSGAGFLAGVSSVSVGFNTATSNGGGGIVGAFRNLGGNWFP